MLKELGLRIARYALDNYVSGDQARGTGHAIEGLVAAYEATGDTTWLMQARRYYTVGGSMSMDYLAANPWDTTHGASWMQCITGEAMAYHAAVDPGWQHAKDMLVTLEKWMATNTTNANHVHIQNPEFEQWGLQGISGAVDAASGADKTTILNYGKSLFDTLIARNPTIETRTKMQSQRWKDPPQFLKYMVLDPNYVASLPNYKDAVLPIAVEKDKGPEDEVFALDADPNPFNPEVRLTIVVPANSATQSFTLKVYNVAGREVADLTARVKSSRVVWNAAGMPSGVYIVKLVCSTRTAFRQITLMK
jgi:hypothetical protein